MSIVDLLALFSDPESLKALTMSQKMLASLVTTILGMGITFVALVVLQLVITVMAKFSSGKPKTHTGKAIIKEPLPDNSNDALSQEEVAAITVSLALLLECSPGNLVIHHIRKVEDSVPVWGRAGLTEQLHNNI